MQVDKNSDVFSNFISNFYRKYPGLSMASILEVCENGADIIDVLIKQKRPDMTVFLAGAPAPEFKQSYLDAGVDDFIHVKANCLQVLSAMQKKKGMC